MALSFPKYMTLKPKVFFSVMNDGKIFKVELPKNYLLDEADVVRLRKIEKVIDVESSI